MNVDIQLLQEYVSRNLISCRKHDTLDLYIWTYTRECKYQNAWDQITTMCRGLITDSVGEVICRPIPKFFNISEHTKKVGMNNKILSFLSKYNVGIGGLNVRYDQKIELPKLKWVSGDKMTTVLKKYDGSLGILYKVSDPDENADAQFAIATKGSFNSDQAIRATKMFTEKGYGKFAYDDRLTYCFEIIYPENRIVVDYGDTSDLILIDVIENESGKSIGIGPVIEIARMIGCKNVEVIGAINNEHQLYDPKANKNIEEGFVLIFPDGTRAKYKFSEYVRLHRILTETSTYTVYDLLRSHQGFEDVLDRVPDSVHKWISAQVNAIQGNYDAIEKKAHHVFGTISCNLNEFSTRKDWANEIIKYPDISSILFKILDKDVYEEMIWDKVKPNFARMFSEENLD